VVTDVAKNEKKLASPLALLRIDIRALLDDVESSIKSRISEIPKESAVVVESIISVTDASVALLNLSTPLPGLPELVDVENV
jgi:hypothetical protein